MKAEVVIMKFAEVEQSIEVVFRSWSKAAAGFRMIRDGTFDEVKGLDKNSANYTLKLQAITGHRTLDEYWRNRWNLTRQNVNRMIQSLEIAEQLLGPSETAVSNVEGQRVIEQIDSEGTIRDLARVPEENRNDALQALMDEKERNRQERRPRREILRPFMPPQRLPEDVNDFADSLAEEITEFQHRIEIQKIQQLIAEAKHVRKVSLKQLIGSIQILEQSLKRLREKLEASTYKKANANKS